MSITKLRPEAVDSYGGDGQPAMRAEAAVGSSLHDASECAIGTVSISALEVAEVVRRASSIGYAYHAIKSAGWRAVIVGNRLTVHDQVSVQYVGAGPLGRGGATWMVHAAGDSAPIWIVSDS